MSETKWTLDCEAFGVRFRLAAESDALLRRMRKSAPWGSVECADRAEAARVFEVLRRGDRYCVSAGGQALTDRGHVREALDDFAHALMLHVAEQATGHVFIHAGVVAWRGRGLVLPGASFAGKTTLVAELMRAGAVFYSDEFAVVDTDGRLHPYARPLGMRAPGEQRQTLVHASALGVAGERPVQASLVAFLEYSEGAVWRPRALPAGIAALEMLRHAVPVRRTPARAMAAVAKMLDRAQTFRSQRGEAAETARQLLAVMERDS